MTKVIAMAGKGGTGKTTLSALLIKYLTAKGLTPVLAVDVASPPNRHIPVADSLAERAKDIIAGKKRPLPFEMYMKAFDIPAAMLTESRLALNPPDILVRPRLDPDLKTEDMNRYKEAMTVPGSRSSSPIPMMRRKSTS